MNKWMKWMMMINGYEWMNRWNGMNDDEWMNDDE